MFIQVSKSVGEMPEVPRFPQERFLAAQLHHGPSLLEGAASVTKHPESLSQGSALDVKLDQGLGKKGGEENMGSLRLPRTLGGGDGELERGREGDREGSRQGENITY